MLKLIDLKGVKIICKKKQKIILGGNLFEVEDDGGGGSDGGSCFSLGWACFNDFQCCSGSCFNIIDPFSGRCSIPY